MNVLGVGTDITECLRIAQMIERLRPGVAWQGWPILVGLAIGGAWGAIANLRGRWI